MHVLHSTGAEDFEATRDALALTPDEERRYHVLGYIDDMGDVLAAADLVLSRAGASSIAEIAALAVPAVLVPYPFATADHQTTNAHLLTDAGAAVMFADADIDGRPFADELLGLLASADRRAEMRAAARGPQSGRGGGAARRRLGGNRALTDGAAPGGTRPAAQREHRAVRRPAALLAKPSICAKVAC